MKDIFNSLIEKVMVWGEKDWDNNKEVIGMFEVYNNKEEVSCVLDKESYFRTLREVRNFGELEGWWMMIMESRWRMIMDGNGDGDGFADWLGKVCNG